MTASVQPPKQHDLQFVLAKKGTDPRFCQLPAIPEAEFHIRNHFLILIKKNQKIQFNIHPDLIILPAGTTTFDKRRGTVAITIYAS